jgi:hypothetical protein
LKLSDPILRQDGVFSQQEWKTISWNLQRYDREFQFLKSLGNKCANPECNFPLSLTGQPKVEVYDFEKGYEVTKDVCQCCYDMYHAIRREYFIGHHKDWRQELIKKRRVLGGDK